MWSQHSKVFLIFLQKIPFFLQSNSFKLVLILDFEKKICLSVLFLLKPTLLDFYFDLYLARLLTVILSYRNVIFSVKGEAQESLVKEESSFTIGYCSKKHNLKICVDVRGYKSVLLTTKNEDITTAARDCLHCWNSFRYSGVLLFF